MKKKTEPKQSQKPVESRMREPQYETCLEIRDALGLSSLGLMSNQCWLEDPKRMVFMLSRYKFVSKMFDGMKKVLEVGCADAFGTRIVRQAIPDVTAMDFDPVFIADCRERQSKRYYVNYIVHDIIKGPAPGGPYDGIYSIDVLEHIPKRFERKYLANIAAALGPNGVCIIGTPTIQSQAYASPPSREGHVNCKDHKELKALMLRYFHNVFMFSMNDEVVHTGFYPMANYLFALCCGKK